MKNMWHPKGRKSYKHYGEQEDESAMLSIHDVVVVRYCDDKWFSSSVMLLQKGDAKSKPIVTSVMTMNGF